MDGQTDNPPPPSCPVPTFGVQQLAEPQLLLGRVEGLLKVVGRVGLGQLVEVDEVRPASGTQPLPAPHPTEGTQASRLLPPLLSPHGGPVLVDERVEGQPIPPAGGEVLDVHLGVAVGKSWGSQGEGSVLHPWGGPSLVHPSSRGHRSPRRLHLAPEQKSVLGRTRLTVVFGLDLDHLDLGKARGH